MSKIVDEQVVRKLINERYENNKVFTICGLIGLIISIFFGSMSLTGKFILESDSPSIITGSIILFFVSFFFIFYAIGKFLDIQNSIQVGKFKDKLQADIDKLWKGTQGSQTVEYKLPSSVKKVCFVDFSVSGNGVNLNLYNPLKSSFYGSENMVFYPVGSAQGLDSVIINHIYLDEIVKSENPYCIDVIDGDVNIHLEKDYGQATVLVTR